MVLRRRLGDAWVTRTTNESADSGAPLGWFGDLSSESKGTLSMPATIVPPIGRDAAV